MDRLNWVLVLMVLVLVIILSIGISCGVKDNSWKATAIERGHAEEIKGDLNTTAWRWLPPCAKENQNE